jgi:hypothetical protein
MTVTLTPLPGMKLNRMCNGLTRRPVPLDDVIPGGRSARILRRRQRRKAMRLDTE